MLRKALILMLALSMFDSLLTVSPLSFELSNLGQSNAIQQNKLPVRNLDTGENYSTIQEAINAPETLDGHTIFVASGTYQEQVTVNKSLSLIGEDRGTTIIDGTGKVKVVYVTADNVEVTNFTMRSGIIGLWLNNSRNSRIINNTLHDGSYGIRMYNSGNSEVVGNNVYNYSFFGVEIKSSGNSILRDNTMGDNGYSFGVEGNSLSDFINDIDTSNTVNGKPIRYLINQHNITIDSSTPFQEIGYLGLVNSTNIRVEDLDVQNNKQGILFAFTRNVSINNVNAEANWNGIYVTHSSNISVTGNNAINNFDYGIKFFNSSGAIAVENDVSNNGWAGIGLRRCHNLTVDGNEASFNIYNLHLVRTNNSRITGNTALVKPGGYSIAVYYSHNNVIYHNAFVNSLLYAEARDGTRFTPSNSWDNGLEGNYWRPFSGVDADQDGISDTPYVVGENNVDDHPLMGKCSDFAVTFGGKTYSISVISNSTISQFQFSPENGSLSFMAAGVNRTTGFWRIAVPNALLQDLYGGNVSFLINDEEPVLKREWTDELNAYFYFSFVDTSSEWAINPWLIAVVAAALFAVSVLVFWVLKKRRGMFSIVSGKM